MSEPFLGEIIMFGGNFNPRNWQLCNGQLLSIAQNTALFSILGTTFGGNGQTTFGLPDMRGRRPVHAGQGPGLSNYVLGELSGSESISLTISNLPSHSHPVNCLAETQTTTSPVNAFPAKGGAYAATADNTMSPGMIGLTGGNIPIQILDPFLCVNFLICVQGIFPSRN